MDKVRIFQRDYSLERPIIDKATRRDYVRFGGDNNYPSALMDLAQNSPLQSAILENKLAYMLGAGLSSDANSLRSPNRQETWRELIRKVMTDFVYYEAYAVQIILNEDNASYSFFHTPIQQVRLGQYNDRNLIEKAYLCADWTRSTRQNIIEIPMFGSEKMKKGQPYLIYEKMYRPDEYYYAIPRWTSAANYISADAALSKYYNNYIRNNFSANLQVTFPSEPDDEKKGYLYEMFRTSFGGSENAGNIVLLFGENGERPEIKPIESVNADLYNQVVDVIKTAIVSANRLTSPVLAGIATSSGFSSKSDEIIAATTQYRLTVINPERQFVLDTLNWLAHMNGKTGMLIINDYNLRDEFEGENVENEVKVAEGIGANEDEISEVKDSDNEATA